MNAAPLVSVILPVFNGARFLRDAVGSILGQHGDIELLIHDDGSTDATAEVLERLAASDARIRVSRAPNAGPAAARNRCLRRAGGDLIAFMDHDDLWPDGRLVRQIRLLESDPSAGAVLGSTFIFDRVDAEGQVTAGPRSRTVLTGLLQAGLFRREVIEAAGSFDQTLSAADDFDLLLRMVEGGVRFLVDDAIAVHYRIHPGQWTESLEKSGSQTLRALHRSLKRRRAMAGPQALVWRKGRDER